MGKIDTVLTRLKAEAANADATAAPTPVARTEITSYPMLPVDQSHVQDNRIVGFGGVSPNALSAYRMIRTRLLQSMRTNRWRSIAISSAGMGEGKSLTSINLALSLSREGNQNVFLIDLDMRQPLPSTSASLRSGVSRTSSMAMPMPHRFSSHRCARLGSSCRDGIARQLVGAPIVGPSTAADRLCLHRRSEGSIVARHAATLGGGRRACRSAACGCDPPRRDGRKDETQ